MLELVRDGYGIEAARRTDVRERLCSTLVDRETVTKKHGPSLLVLSNDVGDRLRCIDEDTSHPTNRSITRASRTRDAVRRWLSAVQAPTAACRSVMSRGLR